MLKLVHSGEAVKKITARSAEEVEVLLRFTDRLAALGEPPNVVPAQVSSRLILLEKEIYDAVDEFYEGLSRV